MPFDFVSTLLSEHLVGSCFRYYQPWDLNETQPPAPLLFEGSDPLILEFLERGIVCCYLASRTFYEPDSLPPNAPGDILVFQAGVEGGAVIQFSLEPIKPYQQLQYRSQLTVSIYDNGSHSCISLVSFQRPWLSPEVQSMLHVLMMVYLTNADIIAPKDIVESRIWMQGIYRMLIEAGCFDMNFESHIFPWAKYNPIHDKDGKEIERMSIARATYFSYFRYGPCYGQKWYIPFGNEFNNTLKSGQMALFLLHKILHCSKGVPSQYGRRRVKNRLSELVDNILGSEYNSLRLERSAYQTSELDSNGQEDTNSELDLTSLESEYDKLGLDETTLTVHSCKRLDGTYPGLRDRSPDLGNEGSTSESKTGDSSVQCVQSEYRSS